MSRQVKNMLVNYIHDKQLRNFAEKYLSGRLIDIGCGTKPYKDMLKLFVKEHIGVDHAATFHDNSNIDLFGTAYEMSVEDESFDSAICTAVLEHLEEPEQALRECSRALKSGGISIYSVPFIWHLHEEPRDFYRYTKYSLEYLFKKTGFEVLEIIPLSGFWVTFGQLFVYNIYRFHRGPLRYIPLVPAIGLVVQGLSYILDRVDKSEQWTWMYMVVARKK